MHDGGVFAISYTGTLLWHWPGTGPSTGNVGALAIGQPDQLYFGSSNGGSGPVMNALSIDRVTRRTAPTAGFILTTPVIGADRLIYAMSFTGFVSAYDTNMSEVWRSPVYTPATFNTSPTIDCGPRLTDGGVNPGPGTLYAVSAAQGKLFAFIVDARGLDTASPWPKFQRDTRNSGNADAPIVAGPSCQ